tara:strand:- start:24126 stop:24341 length:216 start_codon:yes stop_codon:yes gene_type:complete
MLEFKSEQLRIQKNNTVFFVKNNKDRKLSNDKFEDLYPSVKVDGKVYKTKKIEHLSISYVPKNTIIGIITK